MYSARFNTLQICVTDHAELNRPDIPVALQQGHAGHCVYHVFFVNGCSLLLKTMYMIFSVHKTPLVYLELKSNVLYGQHSVSLAC